MENSSEKDNENDREWLWNIQWACTAPDKMCNILQVIVNQAFCCLAVFLLPLTEMLNKIWKPESFSLIPIPVDDFLST